MHPGPTTTTPAKKKNREASWFLNCQIFPQALQYHLCFHYVSIIRAPVHKQTTLSQLISQIIGHDRSAGRGLVTYTKDSLTESNHRCQ